MMARKGYLSKILNPNYRVVLEKSSIFIKNFLIHTLNFQTK